MKPAPRGAPPPPAGKVPPAPPPAEPDDEHDAVPAPAPPVRKPAPPAAPAPSAPAPAAPAPAPHSPGDEVLKMLARLEHQLSQLGAVQQQHEDRLSALAGEPEGGEAAGPGQPTIAELEERELELHTMRRKLSEVTSQLRESAAESTDTEDLRRHLDEANHQVNERSQALERSQRLVQTLQARIETLEQESAGDEREQRRSAELEATKKQVSELKGSLREKEEALEELRQKMDQAREARAAGLPDEPALAAAQDVIERQRGQIERLTEQLEALQGVGDPEHAEAQEARIAELEAEVERHRRQADKQKGGKKLLGRGRKEDEAGGEEDLDERLVEATAELRRQIEEAQEENEELRRRLEQGGGAGDGGGGAAQLQQRIKQLEKELADSKAGTRQAEMTARQELREQLAKIEAGKRAMASSEQKMIRRWARHQSVITFGLLMVLAVVVLVASAMAADGFFPPTVAASVEIEARSRFGAPITDAEAEEWTEWQQATIEDEKFLERLAKRLSDLRLDKYRDPGTLAARLGRDLTQDTTHPGRLMLTLAGTDPEEMSFLLDTLATALAVESSQQATARGATWNTAVRDERHEQGRVRYAKMGGVAIKDHRIEATGLIFAVALAVSVVIGWRIYRSLLRSGSVMEDEGPALAGE
jgi:hypothetical protein